METRNEAVTPADLAALEALAAAAADGGIDCETSLKIIEATREGVDETTH